VIKCVVWDIDNTLLRGTYLESGAQPPAPDPVLLGVARELDGRGIVHAIASKNPPSAADYVAAVTGLPIAAVECGWGRKSDAIARIMDDLGLAPDAVAFVDDDLMERAEVAAALPGVLVLSPEDAAEAPAWPDFRPAVLTAEGRRRGELYAQRRRRQDAALVFGGSRDDFLRHVGTRVTIGLAAPADLPRLHELSVRTHQFNTALEPVSEAALAAQLGSPACALVTVRLRDDLGDDGIVGGAVLEPGPVLAPGPVPAAGPARARVSLLVMSCRALGRGVLDALLAALCRQAAAGGAAELQVPCLVTDRNVPLRLALAAAGFRAPGAGPAAPPGKPVIFARDLAGPLPTLPDWAAVDAAGAGDGPADGPGCTDMGGSAHADAAPGVLAGLREILARVTGSEEAAALPADTPLFRDGAGLDSLTGTLLLTDVAHTFGVDVAAEDLNLDSLASLASLAAFITERRPVP
jgi:FkbH-like protein